MKKTILPEGLSADTPLSFFKNNPKYCMVYTVEDIWIITRIKNVTPKDVQFTTLVNAKIIELSKFPTPPCNDLYWISTALSLVEFIDEHADNIKQHFSIAADIIACTMMCIYKISDEVKNRNIDIIPDAGWKLFDLLAKLIFRNENKRAVSLYFLFQQLIQPKIVDEIRWQMRFVLQQMHDTESQINRQAGKELKCKIYQDNPHLCVQVAELQQSIEKAIETADPQAKKLSTKLRELIKKHQLKANFEDSHFFCTTVNNYSSLQKIIEIINTASNFENLFDPTQQKDFLYCLIQLGEYMSNRKLAIRFQKLFPKISWNDYQIIRDCLCHPENGKNHRLTKQLASGHLENQGISLQGIQEELQVLKEAVTKIIEQHFYDPQTQFYNQYCLKYQVKIKWKCPIIDQVFILDNLINPNETLRQSWQKILSGQIQLPSERRDCDKLKTVVFKAEDQNKKYRKKFGDILNNLSTDTLDEDIEFLREHLSDSAQRPHALELLKEIKSRKLIKKEISILRECSPSVNYGKDTEKQECTLEILNKLEDASHPEICVLYPRQFKLFRKSEIFNSSPERWSHLLNFESVIPTVDEYFKLCQCIVQDQMDNTANEFSLNMNNISEIIRSNFEKRLRRLCVNLMTPESLNNFFNLLEKYPLIREKWWKVMFRETEYPDINEFKKDLAMIRLVSHNDAKEFVKLTVLLQQIQAPTPITSKLKDLFEHGYQEVEAEEEILSKKQARFCRLAIGELTAMSLIILDELYGEPFCEEIMENIVSPTYNASINLTAEINPTFRRFLGERQNIYDDAIAESERTGREVRIPLKKIWQLHREIVIEDPREAEIESQMYSTTEKLIKQAFKDQHDYGLPREIYRNIRFQFALEYHLTRCLSLFKLIIKFSTPESAPFLIKNYIHLKKSRNDLIHGDYIKESIGRSLKEITVELSKCMDAIKGDLENILKWLEKDCIPVKNDQQRSFSPGSPRFYTQPPESLREGTSLPIQRIHPSNSILNSNH